MNTTLLTYSEITYLFADKVVSERSRLFNLDNHPSGQKITVKPLAHRMVAAALIYLIEKEYASLTVKDVKKLFFFPGKAVFGTQLKEAGPDVTGMERVLLENLKTETGIEKAVYHLLDSDEASPWGQAVVITKNSLVEKGYLALEKETKLFRTKKYLYGTRDIRELASKFEEAQHTLAKFVDKTPYYKMIEGEIAKGLADRQERSSTSDD